MAQKNAGEKGVTSMADVAAMLIKPINDAADAEDQREAQDQVEDEDELSTSGETDDTEDESEVDGEELDEPEDESSDDEEGDEEEGDDQPDDEDADDEPEYFDISDEDVLTVVVDGEEREVTIGELKKAHSLGGATEKRLQEATELRKTAHAERTQILEQLAAQERVLTEALSNLDDAVFTPVISEPPQELKRSDPARYLQHQEAYQEDQKRISAAKKAVQDKIEALTKQRKERLDAYAKAAGPAIIQAIPELGDEKTAPQMLNRLVETAKSYGYTEQEINSALDPRMFMLVRDALKLRDMQAVNKERPNVTKLESQNTRKVRRLRSGSASTAKVRARQKDKERQKVVEKARQTGKVADVAATLLTSSRG